MISFVYIYVICVCVCLCVKYMRCVEGIFEKRIKLYRIYILISCLVHIHTVRCVTRKIVVGREDSSRI